MTDKKDKALKLALEALGPFITPNWAGTGVDKANEAYAAIREALAEQPAQDQSQPCPNCESLSKQVTALKTCLEVERGFREQEQPVISGKWAWVPVDPSWAMLIAGNHGQPGDFSAKKVWGDMIAALERSFDYRRPDDPPKTSPQPAQQQECNHCGGTGDVSGEYPGVACPECNGFGIDSQPEFIKHEVEHPYDWSEWVCPNPESYLMKCCDCGLVHEAQFRIAKYQPSLSDECEVVSDPDLLAQFRMRRSEQWSPADTAHRAGGLPMDEQPAQGETK